MATFSGTHLGRKTRARFTGIQLFLHRKHLFFLETPTGKCSLGYNRSSYWESYKICK